MRSKFFVSTLLATLSLTIIAFPVGAVSYDSKHHVQRFNSKGTTFKVLPTRANHFCYLSLVSVEETDRGGEEAKCRVRRSGAVWLLEAILDKSSDADVECGAICYNN